jgi:hypothetical protein
MDPHQPDVTGEAGSSIHNRRKRIVAREVSPAEDTPREPRGPTPEPTDLIEPHAAPHHHAGESIILDPTQVVGERQRRHGANFKYHATQVCIGFSVLMAAIAIACILSDEPLTAQILAGSAFVLAVAAVFIVRSSRLAYRLRGYAAAAGVLAVLSLVASFLPSPFH